LIPHSALKPEGHAFLSGPEMRWALCSPFIKMAKLTQMGSARAFEDSEKLRSSKKNRTEIEPVIRSEEEDWKILLQDPRLNMPMQIEPKSTMAGVIASFSSISEKESKAHMEVESGNEMSR
jgi:hypothetical protein